MNNKEIREIKIIAEQLQKQNQEIFQELEKRKVEHEELLFTSKKKSIEDSLSMKESSKTKFPHEAIHLLKQLVKIHIKKNGKPNFPRISQEFTEHGYCYTSVQLRQKFYNDSL